MSEDSKTTDRSDPKERHSGETIIVKVDKFGYNSPPVANVKKPPPTPSPPPKKQGE